jgi:CBS domain-containing protein
MITSNYFKKLSVSDIMVSPVTCAYENSPIKEVMDQLVVYHFHGLPVIDESKSVVGMITNKDIINAIHQGKEPGGTITKEIMTTTIITAEPESTVYSLIKVMAENEITRIPICRGGNILGIVCQSDIIKKAIGPGIISL